MHVGCEGACAEPSASANSQPLSHIWQMAPCISITCLCALSSPKADSTWLFDLCWGVLELDVWEHHFLSFALRLWIKVMLLWPQQRYVALWVLWEIIESELCYRWLGPNGGESLEGWLCMLCIQGIRGKFQCLYLVSKWPTFEDYRKWAVIALLSLISLQSRLLGRLSDSDSAIIFDWNQIATWIHLKPYPF